MPLEPAQQGKIAKKPTAACAATSTSKVRDQPHWFGNCKAGGSSLHLHFVFRVLGFLMFDLLD
jgi:hypothetical protein